MEGSDEDERQRPSLPARFSGEDSPTSAKPGTPNSSSSRVPRRRAPITNVACQECRKRKTKCDGQRPRCGNCAKRANLVCQYDAEGTQSNRLAIYKWRLEKHSARIEELEAENSRLKEATSHHHDNVTPLTLPAPFQSLSLSPFPQLPPITSSLAASSLLSSIGPLKFPHDGTQIWPINGQREAMGCATSGTMDLRLLEEELSHNQSQKRMLQTENNRLKELMVLLTLLDDRDLAKKMALRIQEEGVTDGLLCEANVLVAAGSVVIPIGTHIPRASRTARLPALSSLELPTISAPYTPDVDPELQARRYPPPPQSLPRAGPSQESQVGWR